MRSSTDIVIMAILGLLACVLACVLAWGWYGQWARVLELEDEIERIGDCEMELQDAYERLIVFYGKEFGEEENWKEAADWSK